MNNIMKKFEFSNFLKLDNPFIYQGMKFYYTETFFVAMKTLDIYQRDIISKMKPGEAKKFGRRLKLRSDWEDIKVKVMKFALEKKFATGTSWYKKLKQTKDEYIVETNYWHDNIWGNCICHKCQDIPGQNILGKLLMEIREK